MENQEKKGKQGKRYIMHPFVPNGQFKLTNKDEIDFDDELFWLAKGQERFRLIDIRLVIYPQNKKMLYNNLCSLVYLNPRIDKDELTYLSLITKEDLRVGLNRDEIKKMVKNIMWKKSTGALYNNGQLRKLIFNPSFELTTDEKMVIIGKYCGKDKLDLDRVKEIMIEMYNDEELITYQKLANLYRCSKSTIYNHKDSFKDEIDLINDNIRLNRLKEAAKKILEEGQSVTQKRLYEKSSISIPLIKKVVKDIEELKG